MDGEEDREYQRFFGEKYDILRQWEYKYDMDIMGILYYQSINKPCISLLSDILYQCIKHNIIYTESGGIQRIGIKNKIEYRIKRLKNSDYIVIKDGFVIPKIKQEYIDKCYFENEVIIEEEKEKEGV